MSNLPPPPSHCPQQHAQKPIPPGPRIAERGDVSQTNSVRRETAGLVQGRAPLPPKPISLPRTRKDPVRQCDPPKLLRSSASAIPSSSSLPKAIKVHSAQIETPQRSSSAAVSEDSEPLKAPESETTHPFSPLHPLSEKTSTALVSKENAPTSRSFTLNGPPKSLAPRPSSLTIPQGTIITDANNPASENQQNREGPKEDQRGQQRPAGALPHNSLGKQQPLSGQTGGQMQPPLPPRKKPGCRLSREMGSSGELKVSAPPSQLHSKSSSQTLPPPPLSGEFLAKENSFYPPPFHGMRSSTSSESPQQQPTVPGNLSPSRGKYDGQAPSPSSLSSSSSQSTLDILPPPPQLSMSFSEQGVDIPPPPGLPQGQNSQIPPPCGTNTADIGSGSSDDAFFVTTSQHSFLRAATLPRLCLYVLSGEVTEGDADIIHSLAYTFEDFSTLEAFLSCLIETYKSLKIANNQFAETKLIEFFLAISMHQRSVLAESMGKIENIIRKGLGKGGLSDKILQLLAGGCDFIPPLKLIPLKKGGISDPAFAEQITLIEWRYFVTIKNTEFAAYVRDNKNKGAFLNLNKLITWTNLFSLWLSVQILNENSTSKRAAAIGKAVALAENLRQLHNYNGVMEVYSSLTHSALYRLKQSWEKVGKKQFEGFKALETLFSPDKNMAFYRQELHDAPYPKMPFVGFFLTDLMFVNDGFPKDTIDVNGKTLINVEKWKKFGKVLTELLACREYDHYTFEGDKGTISADSPTATLRAVTGGIGSANFFGEEGEPAYTDAQLIEISRRVEPRQQS